MAFDVSILHLQFTVEAMQTIHLGPQAGAQLRGALWAALRRFACTSPNVGPNELPIHSQHCPMCRLMHLETWPGERGINPARPFAIRPPLGDRAGEDLVYELGQQFTFGVSLFGDAIAALPYIAKAVMEMGEIGVGYHRGRFRVVTMAARQPFTDEYQDLMPRPGILARPQLILNAVDVEAANIDPHHLYIKFLTPTYLVSRGKPLDTPTLPVLIARLLERCQSLATTYTSEDTSREVWRERHMSLTAQAEAVSCKSDTHWVRIESGSRRISERNAMGGFVGTLSLSGNLHPFLPWLAWGSLLHVGKNAVKGGGWYTLQ